MAYAGEASVRPEDIPRSPPAADEGTEGYHRRLVGECRDAENAVLAECGACKQTFICGLFYCPHCLSAKKYALFKHRIVIPEEAPGDDDDTRRHLDDS